MSTVGSGSGKYPGLRQPLPAILICRDRSKVDRLMIPLPKRSPIGLDDFHLEVDRLRVDLLNTARVIYDSLSPHLKRA